MLQLQEDLPLQGTTDTETWTSEKKNNADFESKCTIDTPFELALPLPLRILGIMDIYKLIS